MSRCDASSSIITFSLARIAAIVSSRFSRVADVNRHPQGSVDMTIVKPLRDTSIYSFTFRCGIVMILYGEHKGVWISPLLYLRVPSALQDWAHSQLFFSVNWGQRECIAHFKVATSGSQLNKVQANWRKHLARAYAAKDTATGAVLIGATARSKQRNMVARRWETPNYVPSHLTLIDQNLRRACP